MCPQLALWKGTDTKNGCQLVLYLFIYVYMYMKCVRACILMHDCRADVSQGLCYGMPVEVREQLQVLVLV